MMGVLTPRRRRIASCLVTVEDGHLHIHQDGIERLQSDGVESDLTVLCDDDTRPARRRMRLTSFTVGFAVFDQEHGNVRENGEVGSGLCGLRRHQVGRGASKRRTLSSGPVAILAVNVLPSPGRLTTEMHPPSNSAICRLMANPSPVPPNRRVIDWSA